MLNWRYLWWPLGFRGLQNPSVSETVEYKDWMAVIHKWKMWKLMRSWPNVNIFSECLLTFYTKKRYKIGTVPPLRPVSSCCANWLHLTSWHLSVVSEEEHKAFQNPLVPNRTSQTIPHITVCYSCCDAPCEHFSPQLCILKGVPAPCCPF